MYNLLKKFRLNHKSIYIRGFTLLFASLVASLLTALGLAMANIAQKEVLLSSISRDSQYAFYAADTGAECATYLDFHFDAFATSTVYTTPVSCTGSNVRESTSRPDSKPTGLGGTPQTTFQFEVGGRCVEVKVNKKTSLPFTQIESLGYNTTCADTSNPRRLERAVRAIF